MICGDGDWGWDWGGGGGGLWGLRFVCVNEYVYEFLNEYEEKGFGYDAEKEKVMAL